MDEEPVRSKIKRNQELKDLPEEVLIDKILLKLPVKSLLKLRCVSRYFRNLISSPTFVKLHLHHQQQQPINNNNNHILISTRYVANYIYDDGISRANVDVIHNYICNFNAATNNPHILELNCPFEYTDIRASCNGLLYLHGRMIHTKFTPNYIWNPCTKEYKELPSTPPSTLLKNHQKELRFDDYYDDKCSTRFCGFGYDRTVDEYKVMYYEYLVEKSDIYFHDIFDKTRNLEELFDSVRASTIATTEFKLYNLRTNTWTSVHDNPYKSLYFGHRWQRIGMLVNGALHWIMSSEISSRSVAKAKIIAFDMDKEMFHEVQKPPPLKEQKEFYGNLQSLQGCLCLCRFPLEKSNNEVDIWMLKDYVVKDSWTRLFRVDLTLVSIVDGGCREPKVISEDYFKLLGLCENGEIVMMTHLEDLVLYDPVNNKARHDEKFEGTVKKYWNYQMDYTESLVSIN